MPNVKFKKAGRYAHPVNVQAPQIQVKVGQVVDLDDVWAARVIGKGAAEATRDAVTDPEDEDAEKAEQKDPADADKGAAEAAGPTDKSEKGRKRKDT